MQVNPMDKRSKALENLEAIPTEFLSESEKMRIRAGIQNNYGTPELEERIQRAINQCIRRGINLNRRGTDSNS